MIFLIYEKADRFLFKISDLQVTLNHILVLCLLRFRRIAYNKCSYLITN